MENKIENKNSNNPEQPTADSQAVTVLDAEKEIRDIPIDSIKFNDFWHRTDLDKDVDSLMESIEKTGLLQFPGVTDNGDGTYTLVYGHCRYICYKHLGHETVPCRIIRATSLDAGFYCLIENDLRQNLHPVNEALTLKQLKEASGLSDEKLAKKIHRNQSYVTDRIGILGLPKDVVAKIGTNRKALFRFAHAVELSRHARTNRFNRDNEVRRLYKKTTDYKLTSTQLEDIVRFIKDGRYDRLPGNLRTLILSHECMTPKVADLFLCPEELFKGDDSEDKLLGERIKKLTPKEREDIVLTAVEERWPERHIKRRLKKFLNPSSQPGSGKEENPVKALDSQFSSFIHKLRDSEYDLDNFTPDALAKLCDRCQRLIDHLKSLQSDAVEVAKSKTKNKITKKIA